MIVDKLRLLTVVCASLGLVSPALAGQINLVDNGDFEQGNTKFSSDYAYSPAINTTESQYTVSTNPYPWNPNFRSLGDHTTGTGNMFIGNGSPRDESVWSSGPIAVTAGADYFFEAWAINVDSPDYEPGTHPEAFAILSFYANGQLLGTKTTQSLGSWEGLSNSWNSGSSTSVILEIRNSNQAVLGNDFAVDDIFLGTESSITSAVPEPSSLALLGLGGLAALGWRRYQSTRRFPARSARTETL